MSLYFNKDIDLLYVGSNEVSSLYFGGTQIWPVGLPVGTTFDFSYTGAVQSIDLPKGRYKLQCWGAQGGNVTGSYSCSGSKGGYSEGILKLDEPKTLYVFVGGRGTSYTSSASQTSTSVVNGGWNGGGAGKNTVKYNSDGTYGCSFPRGGGGATDIALETSSMSYSSGRTTRTDASLKSRIIVAGGGAGASARYTESEEVTTDYTYLTNLRSKATDGDAGNKNWPRYRYHWFNPEQSGTYKYVILSRPSNFNRWTYEIHQRSPWTLITYSELGTGSSGTITIDYSTYPNDTYSHDFCTYCNSSYTEAPALDVEIYSVETSTSTSTSKGTSNQSQQGGGTSGKGQYPGKQNAAGNSGAFGLGANVTVTNYRYSGGAGGGGWYGGGTSYSDSSTSYINYSGGGSGFVNIAANASYRPSGYTGLELESGQTIAGNTSFPSPSGGTETGHGGDGFARITFVGENGEDESGGGNIEPSIEWTVQTGSWNKISGVSGTYDGLMWQSDMHTNSGSTVIRCTFSGITNIKFDVLQDSEYNYDYLTAGKLDTPCTRSSYNYTFKGLPPTGADDCQYYCDSGEHFVEFCYSKDGSDSSGTDSATVYISAIS